MTLYGWYMNLHGFYVIFIKIIIIIIIIIILEVGPNFSTDPFFED